MVIEILTPETYSDWDTYVACHPDSTCYHLRAWKTVAQKAYGIEAPFLIARSAPRRPVCGVLPLFVVRSVIQGHVTNGLFGAYGTILADNEWTRCSLILRAKEILHEAGLNHLMLKCLKDTSLPAPVGLQSKDFWVIATLALDPDPQKIWSNLKDKTRNCVRKASRYGLEVRTGRDQLHPFYDVLAENMHKKGTPIYGRRFMEELLHAMDGRAEVMTLWHQDQAVAGAFLIDFGQTTYVPFASSRPNTLFMCPNNLLYWEIIKRGCLNQMTLLDFGRSQKESGPLAFKLSWGAEVLPQPTYVYTPDEEKHKLDPKDRRVDWFVRQWKRLPRPVADTLGPMICRRLAGLI